MNVGDKIYYLDYEDTQTAYTIKSIIDKNNKESLKKEIYYIIHPDSLPEGIGYYSINENSIDSDSTKGRFFSSPELAHKRYLKFKKYIEDNNL